MDAPQRTRISLEDLAVELGISPKMIARELSERGVDVPASGIVEVPTDVLYKLHLHWAKAKRETADSKRVQEKKRKEHGALDESLPRDTTTTPPPEEQKALKNFVDPIRPSNDPSPGSSRTKILDGIGANASVQSSKNMEDESPEAIISLDFALILTRSEFDGQVVFPDANVKTLAMCSWITSTEGGGVPEANMFPPRGRDRGASGIRTIEAEFQAMKVLTDANVRNRRLYIYAAGPVLANDRQGRVQFLCPDAHEPGCLGPALDAIAQEAASSGMFEEVLLLVDGVEVELASDDERRHSGITMTIERLLGGIHGPPGRVFSCITRSPAYTDARKSFAPKAATKTPNARPSIQAQPRTLSVDEVVSRSGRTPFKKK